MLKLRHALLILSVFSSIFFSIFTSPVLFAKNFDVIAHRGASGYLPEHTLEAATLAFAMGPDFIEQDAVITKDGIAVVLHDIHLETVTNVEQVFPNRAREDGRFYALDFTLAELRTLQVHERANNNGEQVFTKRYTGNIANFTVATLEEHYELITQLNREFNTDVGVYTEVKSPAWHAEQGVDASQIVIASLTRFNLSNKDANSYLQCFDFNEIKRIRTELNYAGKVVLLMGENSWGESTTDYNWVKSEAGMKVVANYADGLGPWLGQLLDEQAMTAGKVVPAAWVEFAHNEGFVIHPYTFRQDALPPGMTETQLLNTLKHVVKVDGVFTDHVPPVKAWLEAQSE
ncbi:glycerophosphodiester phosphodiesterase [Alteromonas sp. 1_MG-2023]|uniref:glycerophosphodiester phosphodiesterase n=1 Tax=Alteromonas sp. 1_MG-2023 TaxID=3062669 RepID=UPI0026E33867|nr:glycerophosphodiester phosphodiesterase [Alteromonas sp. 1_MG-2023]MDO6567126.1 glycerophosphodiester phosphodiesterase [Alteromonas sp. 1_MG-2023]